MLAQMQRPYIRPDGSLNREGWFLFQQMSDRIDALEADALNNSPFFVDYAEDSYSATIPANARTRLFFNGQVRDTNRPDEFAGHDFFQSGSFFPVNNLEGGQYLLRLFTMVTASVVDTDIRVEADVDSLGITFITQRTTIPQAGSASPVNMTLSFYAGSPVVDGVSFYITPSQDITLSGLGAFVQVLRVQ